MKKVTESFGPIKQDVEQQLSHLRTKRNYQTLTPESVFRFRAFNFILQAVNSNYQNSLISNMQERLNEKAKYEQQSHQSEPKTKIHLSLTGLSFFRVFALGARFFYIAVCLFIGHVRHPSLLWHYSKSG